MSDLPDVCGNGMSWSEPNGDVTGLSFSMELANPSNDHHPDHYEHEYRLPEAPFHQAENNASHGFIGDVQEPVDIKDEYFPEDEAQGMLESTLMDDESNVEQSETEFTTFDHSSYFLPLLPVETQIPDPNGEGVLANARDQYVEAILRRYKELKRHYKASKSTKEIGDLYEPFKALWDEWLWIWNHHIITAAPSLDIFVHKLRIKLPIYVSRCGFAYYSLPSTKAKSKTYDKIGALFITREPAPCAPQAHSKIGPINFELVLRPGVKLVKPIVLHATTMVSQYADWNTEEEGAQSGSRGGRDSATAVESGPLRQNEDGSYTIDHISFTSTSNGRVFEVNFTFTLYEEGGTNHDVSVRSLPMACLSNIGSQWASGEGRYVANLAFGMCNTKNAPLPELRYPALVNALQFAHLTCTRQIGSAYFIKKLKVENDKAKRHFERKKTNANSDRSAKARQHTVIYDSFTTYSRLQRLLTLQEIRSVFAPHTPITPQLISQLPRPKPSAFASPDNLPPPDCYVDITGNGQFALEYISYDLFCRKWRWYGELMYKLYTGQTEGVEVRSLWLRHLIHLVAPGSSHAYSTLSSADHGVGTALIRTSTSRDGVFAYAFVKARTGQPHLDYAYKTVEASSNDFSATLNNEAAILRLLNTHSTLIEKDVVVAAYMPLIHIPPPREDGVAYQRGLTPDYQHLNQSMGNMTI